MQTRILILSAGAGAGHNRAAEAVALALEEMAPQAFLYYVDVLMLASKVFRRISRPRAAYHVAENVLAMVRRQHG